MKKVTVKEVLSSDNWVITKVIRGYNGVVRINAKTRFGVNLFCEWCSEKYADRLCKDRFGKKTSELNSFKYE